MTQAKERVCPGEGEGIHRICFDFPKESDLYHGWAKWYRFFPVLVKVGVLLDSPAAKIKGRQIGNDKVILLSMHSSQLVANYNDHVSCWWPS